LKTGTAGAERRARTVWLGLGTNVGDLAGNLARALAALEPFIDIDAVSAVYETEPFGYVDQPLFWNLALRGRTRLDPRALLGALQQCERDVGRTPTFRMGPRLIDIDLLLYDDIVMDSAALRVPHPGLHERAFVLLPLLELDPGLVHPVTGVRLDASIAARDPAGVRRLGDAADVLRPWTLPGGAPNDGEGRCP
jgi:2-amino-4-hydroxy-6-hydroxymethyldihydropteridine diphosphokinase